MRKKRSKRHSVALDIDISDKLEDLSVLTHASISAIIGNAVKEYLEKDEDAYWIKITKERENSPRLTHEEVWGNSE